jgi:hypothetical protein
VTEDLPVTPTAHAGEVQPATGPGGSSGNGTGRLLDSTRSVLEILSGAAGLAYTALIVAYDAFYWNLGTSPEAVGVTYISTLGQAAPVFILFVAIALATYLPLRRIPVRRRAGVYVATAYLILGIVVYRAHQDAGYVKRGCPVSGVHVAGIPLVNVATPITVISWALQSKPPPIAAHTTLLYLGTGAAHVVVYNPAEAAPVLLPTASVVASETGEVPQRCR